MKRSSRRAAIIALLLALALALSGCGRGASVDAYSKNYVAIIGDMYLSEENYEAWKSDLKYFDEVYGRSLSMMLGLGDSAFSDATALFAYVRYCLVTDALGYEANDPTVDEAAALFLKNKRESIRDGILAEKDDVPTDEGSSEYEEYMSNIDRQVDGEYQSWTAESGMTEEAVRHCVSVYKTIQLLYTQYASGVVATRADVEKWYDEELADQKKYAETDPSGACGRYVDGWYDIVLYVPEGLRVVKAIQISFADWQIADLETLSGADYDYYWQKCAEAYYPSAFALWNSLLYGADFDASSQNYNGKSEYRNEDGTAKELLLYEGMEGEDDLVRNAFQLAEPGHMSGLVQGSEGYIVVKYIRPVTSGAIPLESVYESASSLVTGKKMLDTWYAALDKLEEDAGIRYPSGN